MTGHFPAFGRIRVPDQPIDVTTYDVLWELALGNTAKPHVLACVSPGDTIAHRMEIHRHAQDVLQRTGYLDGQGVRPDVKELLSTLVRPPIAVNMRWFVAHHDHVAEHRARIAQRGALAVMVKLDQHSARLSTLGGRTIEQEVRALVQQWSRPARFSGVQVWPDQIQAGQVRPALLTGAWQRRWYITATAYNHAVSRECFSAPLTISDNRDGRYVAFRQRPQISITPDTVGTVERRIGEMIKFAQAGSPEETGWPSSSIF